MKRVLVTRPEPGASRTAARLEKLGYAAIKLPLSRTLGLNLEVTTESYDLVIATSANAFLWLDKAWVEKLSGLPTHVVGDATAAAARKVGFKDLKSAGSDLSGLLENLTSLSGTKPVIAYLCGKVRRLELEQALPAKGFAVASIAVYDTESVSYTTENLKELVARPIDAVLLTSVNGTEQFNLLSSRSEYSQIFDNVMIFCFSQRIAEPLDREKKRQIFIGASPDEDGMVALLQRYCPA